MRNRSNSGVRLDYYQRLLNKTILKYQNPVTGLLPASEENSHAWVRDNVYAVLSVWALALAYRKTADLDEDRAKAYELEQSVVKLMRGLLRCMMSQVEKLERFKHTQHVNDSLHAKYCSKTGKTVVGDQAWGHLQIDATSLYILSLAQMTASGLQIIFTLDEVSFVQNLIFYIETAYRTPDYGIWERGDKTNHGLPELNSSSIGMAKAALEAINELDLFGARGGPLSVVHVLPDEAQQCQAILLSMLPRESNSKEIDAALLTVISFPAFAVDDGEKVEETRDSIVTKLEGKYGFCRFLRDGYKTAREDPNRLHYEPWELQVFERIECQWPMFFALFVLDGLFNGREEQVKKYSEKLDSVMIKTDEGIHLLPELYAVHKEMVEQEYKTPNSQKREAIGRLPHRWGQSLYIISKLVQEGFLSPGELDPLNRRLVSEPKPDIVVQVVILAEDNFIQSKLWEHGIKVQTMEEVRPLQVFPASVLTQIYSLLGRNKKMGLTGRPKNEIGLLATSKLYTYRDQILAFIPQTADEHQFYLPKDTLLKLDMFANDVGFLSSYWGSLGRPLLIFPVSTNLNYLDVGHNPPGALIGTIKKLQSGYIAGTRVHLGNLADFVTTSCITKLSFLRDPSHSEEVKHFVGDIFNRIPDTRPRLLSSSRIKTRPRSHSKSSVHGIVRRSRSIQVDPAQAKERVPSPPSLQESLKKFERGITVDREQSGGVPIPTTSAHGRSHDVEFPIQRPHSPNLHLKGSLHPLHYSHQSPCSSSSPQLFHFFHQGAKQESIINVDELVEQLNNTEVLHEQADIIHYLYLHKGPDWEITIDGKKCYIKELLVELYEKAGHWKHWGLVRHTAGLLKKRVEELALAATDLLVRQKQLSVGLPPDRERVIMRPLPPDELAKIIFDACGEDLSTASLTQELLIYLAMFIRTEPKLFNEMLRLRVGLIIQVMASELARTLKCSGDEASEHLMNLSPFEMKTLLHHILSGKEFVISTGYIHTCVPGPAGDLRGVGVSRWTTDSETDEHTNVEDECRLSVSTKKVGEEATEFARLSRKPHAKIQKSIHHIDPNDLEKDDEGVESDRQGQWLRRRRLDGALNRVPVGFYPRVWKVLKMCHGLVIEGQHLPHSLTREMTPGEFKFALHVEMVLNRIPQPEYRQLMVEALMVLTLLTENDNSKLSFSTLIYVDKIVQTANAIYLKDQKIPSDVMEHSKGAAGISLHFYDTAPSGRFGTMSYLCRALATILPIPVDKDANVDCAVS
ncbi:phosphorylase b kinase regulatory subunit alpha, liver isoform-like isoform X1 [Crassostrea angulata]|uniref:phosphorylase b kinase regulatory subunit alpha, liver isoform-like isoform X1 n=1 Tax=Magallana angulata TaxID=2784310 RepID=UPI0022B1D780|nr:phosphorylase b kinase regulatory subunit alpha, liver isoform-like isoform X1 [Crassostrea angulata]